jgi:hypothetical protein
VIDLHGMLSERRLKALARSRWWRRMRRRRRIRAAATIAITGLRTETREKKTLAATGMRAVTMTGIALVGSGVLVWITQTLPGRVHVIVDRLGWHHFDWLSGLGEWLSMSGPQEFSPQPVLAAALGVTGTFAGVYFATVAFVVNSTYKDASTRIRDLVTRQPAGRVYTFIYVQAVLFGLIALALPMVGQELNRLSSFLLAFLAAFVVFTFGGLRQQFFKLLEPSTLFDAVERELDHQLRGTVVKWRRRPQDAAVVAQSRETVHELLLTLRDLCGLVLDRERSAKGEVGDLATADPRVASAFRRIQLVWAGYAPLKRELETMPGWSPDATQHKDWMLAGHTEVIYALATSTPLTMKPTRDLLWVERMLAGSVSELLHGRDARTLAGILASHVPLAQDLAARGQLEEARLWVETIAGVATRAAISEASVDSPSLRAAAEASDSRETGRERPPAGDHRPSEGGAADRAVDRIQSAAEPAVYDLVDVIGQAHVQVARGLHIYVAALHADVADWTVRRITSGRFGPLGPQAIAILQEAQDAFAFEAKVEGRLVTSDADVAQLLARAVGGEVRAEIGTMQTVLERDYRTWVQSTALAGPFAAGAALNRMAEALTQWGATLDEAELLLTKCQDRKRTTDDRWPDLDLKAIRVRHAGLERELALPIAELAAAIDPTVEPGRPDLFGWAFHRTFIDLLRDVLQPPDETTPSTAERFRLLAVAAYPAGRRLRDGVGPHHPRVINSATAEPFLMLYQLCGAAMVIAELAGRPEVFAPYASVWAGALSTTESAQGNLDVACSVITADDRLPGLSNRKLLRSEFEVQIKAALEPYGITVGVFGSLDEPSQYFDSADREGRPELTADARKYLNSISLGVMGHFEEVFVAAHLVPHALAHGATLVDVPRHFQEVIDRFAENGRP